MLSEQQEQFVKFAVNGKNTIASATAGAGKTFTLAAAANAMIKDEPNTKGIAVTFSKPLADELNKKLPEAIPGKTIHSLCYSTVAKWRKMNTGNGTLTVDEQKYRKILKNYDIFGDEATEWMEDLTNIQSMPLSKKALNEYLKRQYLDDYEMVKDVITDGINEYLEKGTVTYNDMVWYPILLEQDKAAWKNSLLLLDETQDVSDLYLSAIKLHLRPNAQIIAVGDAQQTVHTWNGIPITRFTDIKKELNSREIRFPITYRLPQSNVKLLYDLNLTNDIVTKKQNDGDVSNVDVNFVLDNAKPGDLILSRFHAGTRENDISLTALGLALLRRGKPIRYVRFNPLQPVQQFVEFVERSKVNVSAKLAFPIWEENLKQKLSNTISRTATDEEINEKLERLNLKIETVKLHLDIFNGSSVNDFLSFVKELYNRNRSDNAIVLCSAHASKGLESDNVYIINPHQFMSFRRNPTVEEYVSEANVMFVAFSRSKENLLIVGDIPTSVRDEYLNFFKGDVYANK